MFVTADLLPFEDLPKTPLLDLLPSVSLVGDDVLPSLSLVGDDVLTDALAGLVKSAAALADLALVRVSDVGDDVPRLVDFPMNWAFAGAAWRATMTPTEAMDRTENFIVSRQIVSMINRGCGSVE